MTVEGQCLSVSIIIIILTLREHAKIDIMLGVTLINAENFRIDFNTRQQAKFTKTQF